MWGQQGQQGGWGQQGQQGWGQQNQQGWGQQGQQGAWGQQNQQGGWGQQGQQGAWGQQGQQGGFVQQGWGQQGQQGGFNQQQGGMINLSGFSGGMNNFMNRWGNNTGYQNMSGYVAVDYSGGWNPNQHDQLLRNNIDSVFQKYDQNFSGSLEGQQFFNAYRDLCLMMGICPPNDYQSVWNAALQSDSNRDNRTTRMEMFLLFKKIQGVNTGYGY